jgi:tetratricopeptide (TPR) repeat protein
LSLPFLLLAPLLAQLGPTVGPAAGALPQAPLQIPRARPAVPATAAPPTRLEQCLALVRSGPLDAIDVADSWAAGTNADGADAMECKALALSALQRWDQAGQAFIAARDLLAPDQRTRRAQLGTSAGIATDSAGDHTAALALLDTAHGDALAAGNVPLAGRIALDRASPLAALGRTAEVAAALAEARATVPASYEVWLISARFSRQQGALAEAQTQIESAARLDPRDPAIGLEAGVIAMLSGREESARRSWESVLIVAPGSDEAQTAQGYLDQLGPVPAPAGR